MTVFLKAAGLALALPLAACQVEVDDNMQARLDNAAATVEGAAESAANLAESAAGTVENAADEIGNLELEVDARVDGNAAAGNGNATR